MHQLRLAPEKLASIRQAVDAPADGEGVAWGDPQVHAFSLRVEAAIERALRASHPHATDAEISFATAAYWAEVLDAVSPAVDAACAPRAGIMHQGAGWVGA